MTATTNTSGLMHLPPIAKLDYHRKLIAQGLVNRGISIGALYFWYNLLMGNYKHLPVEVVSKDLTHFCKKYPEFENDFTKLI
jgi:hypothetical protein